MRLTDLIDVIGCHAEGEIGNVVVGGVGDVPGETMLDKRNFLHQHRDDLRQRLLREPRGNVVRSVNVVLPSNNPAAAMGYVVMESTEYPVMSGSNTICVATVLLETGMVPMVEPITELTLESPAGLIDLVATCRDGKVTSVRFTNQPAFVYHLDAMIDVPGLGTFSVDVAWGGMAYVLIDAASVGFALHRSEARELCVAGQRIKTAAAQQLPAVHPEHPHFPGITQTQFTGPVVRDNGVLTAKTAVIVSPGRVDRSACGTGTSARLAVMHARDQITVGENFLHRSILNTHFDGVIERLTTVGGVPAVAPSIAGQAWITGFSKIGRDPSDPFPTGYGVADTWPESPGSAGKGDSTSPGCVAGDETVRGIVD